MNIYSRFIVFVKVYGQRYIFRSTDTRTCVTLNVISVCLRHWHILLQAFTCSHFWMENHAPLPKVFIKQESPPAWTQEAHRPLRSIQPWMGGWGGFPSSLGWGTPPPVKDWMGYPPPPVQDCMGQPPHPRLDGESPQSKAGWGTPSLGWGVPPISRMGYPQSEPGMGYSPVQTWVGVPPISRMGYPPLSRPGMWYPSPLVQTWDGVPPISRMGYPPPSRPGMWYPSPLVQTWEGVPPHQQYGVSPSIQTWDVVPLSPLSRPGMGYPPHPIQIWDGVPHPPTEMVDKVKTLPSVILRMRAVMIKSQSTVTIFSCKACVLKLENTKSSPQIKRNTSFSSHPCLKNHKNLALKHEI